VKFKEAAYTVSLSGNYEYEADSIRIHYTSPTTPSSIYFYNVNKVPHNPRLSQG